MLQGEGLKVGQALQQSLQAGIPQVIAITQVQGLQSLEASQAACPLICNPHTPADTHTTLNAMFAEGEHMNAKQFACF